MQPCPDKQKQDAKDARMVWEVMYGLRLVPLSQAQSRATLSGLDLMAEYSDLCGWIKRRLRQWVHM
jgi:hypothetical protein